MILIEGGTIVDNGRRFEGYILIENDRIKTVSAGNPDESIKAHSSKIIDASSCFVIPGVIDDQVHFRQPGLEYKADIESESRAAAAGGVTSFMDMPNTNPQTTTLSAWQNKMDIAQNNSFVNYAFFFGATNSNIDDIHSVNRMYTPGIKVFMGSSTGGMLVDDKYALSRIFAESDGIVAIHSEDEKIILENIEKAKSKFGDNIPFEMHPIIRSNDACVRSTERAMELAVKYGTRLHILHVSTSEEVSLLSPSKLSDKQITAEVCIPHIHFSSDDYQRLGARIKCNPAVKSSADREAIWKAISDGRLDIVATDHAPHLLSEKNNSYLSSPSGMPMVQHSLPVMLTHGYSVEKVVSLMCNKVADLFHIENRGYIKENYFADIVIIRKADWTVSKDNILYKCGWSPIEGENLKWKVEQTIVSGKVVYENGVINNVRGQALKFKVS